MALFRKKSIEEMEKELKDLEEESKYRKRKRELSGQIWKQKTGRATDVLHGMYNNLQKVHHEVAKAYTPENVKRMKKVGENIGI